MRFMKNYRFISKCIIALLSCIIGLTSCGNDNKIPTNEIHYTTIDNSVLPIKDYFGEGRIVSNSYVPDKNVCILKLDKDVTEIGDRAFFGCSSFTSISISDDNKVYDSREDSNAIIHTESNTLIRGCENSTIPPSVTKIGGEAFDGCESLTSITIPPLVTKIGEFAFFGCKNLTSITIPESVTEIGDGAFEDCSNLTFITLPESLTEIEKRAFSRCSSLTSITIPESVTEIGDCAFFHCSSLASILIPPSVTEIGQRAFLGCSSLTSITIPESVTKIGHGAFRLCSGLTSITVSKDNKVYDSRENCNAIIHTESNTLIRGCENSTIPPSVTKIGGVAFYGCSSLTSITIPPSVTEIRRRTFRGCTSLTEVRIPNGCNVDEDAFKDCPKVQIIRY